VRTCIKEVRWDACEMEDEVDWEGIEINETKDFVNKISGILRTYCPDIPSSTIEAHTTDIKKFRVWTGIAYQRIYHLLHGRCSIVVPYPTRGRAIDYERVIMDSLEGRLFQVRKREGKRKWDIAFERNGGMKIYFETQSSEDGFKYILLTYYNAKHYNTNKDALSMEGWVDAVTVRLPVPRPFPLPPAHVDVLARLTERVARLESNFLP
jgi:hypothetical protein